MSIVYIIYPDSVTDEFFNVIKNDLIVSIDKKITVCNNISDSFKAIKNNEIVLCIRKGSLTNAEKDLLTWFRGFKILLCFDTSSLYKNSLYFSNVAVYNDATGEFEKQKSSKL
jgi:hypothetical protein